VLSTLQKSLDELPMPHCKCQSRIRRNVDMTRKDQQIGGLHPRYSDNRQPMGSCPVPADGSTGLQQFRVLSEIQGFNLPLENLDLCLRLNTTLRAK
jgi:hypothetical protein